MRSRGAPPSTPTMKRCDRVPSSHAFQCRYNNWSAMWAFTLLSEAAFVLATLHAFVVQPGNTADVNAIWSPAGDQIGPVAPPLRSVSCLRDPPFASATQSWPPAMYATRLP